MTTAIFAVGLLYLCGHLFTAVFARTRVPDVLLLILLGVIAGPVLGLVQPSDFGKVGPILSVIALVVLLFESGTTLSLDTLGRILAPTLLLVLLTFFCSTVMIAIVCGTLLHFSPMVSILTGVIGASTSPSVVIPLAKGLHIREDATAVLVLESALSDVLCIILAVGLMDAATGHAVSSGKLVGGIVSSFTFATVIGLVGGIGWLLVLDVVRRIPSSMFTALAYMLILYAISEFLGFSGGITALVFGLAITNRHYLRFDRLPMLRDRQFAELSEQERAFYGEAVFLLKLFFFFDLGISVRVGDIRMLLIAGLTVLLLLLARFLISLLVTSRSLRPRDRALAAIMGPKGAGRRGTRGAPCGARCCGGPTIRSVIYLLVVVSIVATASLVPIVENKWVGAKLQALFARRGLFGMPVEEPTDPVVLPQIE